MEAIDAEILEHLKLLENGQITVVDFEDWLVPNTWDTRTELVAELDHTLAEKSLLTEDQLICRTPFVCQDRSAKARPLLIGPGPQELGSSERLCLPAEGSREAMVVFVLPAAQARAPQPHLPGCHTFRVATFSPRIRLLEIRCRRARRGSREHAIPRHGRPPAASRSSTTTPGGRSAPGRRA